MVFLALRHLLARKKQTALIMLGIFIGTAGYVVISSMILGVQDFMRDSIIENDAHIRISAREEPVTPESIRTELFDANEFVRWRILPTGRRGHAHIQHAQGWFDRLQANPDVLAYTPNLITQVIFRRGSTTHSGTLIGTDPIRQVRITAIEDNIIEGSFLDIGHSGNRIVLGDGLLEKLGARVTETVLISVGKGEPEPFKIVGAFHIGIPQFDDTMAYGALGDVQKINRTPSRITDIAVRLVHPENAGNIAATWKSIAVERIRTWEDINEQILSAFKVQDAMRYIVTVAILIVAAFGIYNVLTIVITQKQREISILRSIGFDSGDILRLFLFQGWLMGAIGGLLGLGAGFLLCIYLGSVQFYPENVAMKGYLPFSFDPSIYLVGFCLAFSAAVIASILPARHASRLTPIDILRQGME